MKVSLAAVFATATLVLLVASSVHAVSSVSPWQAFWTDSRHGGMIATCVEGTNFWGVYSGIGYLQGNISADGTTATGNWYESGHTDGATGGFVWTLNSNLNGFTGIRRTQYIRCAPAIWSETKITTSTPARTDCLRVYDNSQVSLLYSTIEGTYTNGFDSALHICLSSDGLYEMSAFQGTILSYGSGYARGSSSVIGTGSYIDTSSSFSGSNHGIEMYLLADPFENNLGLGSNNGTVLYQIRYVGANSAADISAATSQAVVVKWQRSSIAPQSCALQRVLYQQPWLGAWTDVEFGFGRLYVGQGLDGRLRGVYSELGWIEGQVSPDGQNVTGRFYDAGDTHQVSGDFTWTLLDPSHFIGQWSFDNSAHRYTWNETRVSVIIPTAAQCLYPDSSVAIGGTTIAGTWRYDTSPTADTLDVCFSADNTRFEASYNFNGGTSRGYITGFVREFGTALQGEWHESGLQGILTIFLTSQNTIRMLRWNHGDIQAAYYYNCDDENGDILWMRHRSVSFSQRISTSAKASSCARNADLISFVQVGPFVPVGFTDKYAVSYVAFHEPKKRNVFDALLAMFGGDGAAQNVAAEGEAGDDGVQSAASLLSSSIIASFILSAVVVLLCCTF